MGSGEAKRFRDMYGSAGRHGQSFWEEEKDNVGMKLLRGMGWENGQGLGKDGRGRTDAVKQFRKKDNAGIGAKAGTRDEAFKASQELFNDVLSRLAVGPGADAATASEQSVKALGTAASDVKGVMARRQLSRRFCRAQQSELKGTGVVARGGMAKGDMASGSAMDEIFGRAGRTADGLGAEEEEADANGESRSLQRTVSAVSVTDYFARRRAELGLPAAGQSGGGGGSASAAAARSHGFTLEDQAHFAEEQHAFAYSGRRGLGSMGRTGGGGDDDDAPTRTSRGVGAAKAVFIAPPLPAALVASPSTAASTKKAAKAERKAAAKAERKAAKKAERKAAKKAERKAVKKADREEPAEAKVAEAAGPSVRQKKDKKRKRVADP